ncbi:MAG: putative b-glycosidase, glycoside hydrolase family 8 protein, partial [Bacteroidota bacterium]
MIKFQFLASFVVFFAFCIGNPSISYAQTNEIPEVILTTPAADVTVDAPLTFVMDADAVDYDGYITKIEFYINGQLVGTDNQGPFEHQVFYLLGGVYNMYARAYDNKGASDISPVISVTVDQNGFVNTLPTISIVSPNNNSTFAAPGAFPINIVASDPDLDDEVYEVALLRNDVVIAWDSIAPFQFSIVNLPSGTYDFKAVAYDYWYGNTTSNKVRVTVGNGQNSPPLVFLDAPINNATFTTPLNFLMTATASDPGGSVKKVEFYRDNVYIGVDSVAPYVLAATSMANGFHELKAKATDNLGSTSFSNIVKIYVADPNSNKKPTAKIISPIDGAVFTAPATFSIEASVQDTDGVVKKVEFYRGGNIFMASDTTAPFRMTLASAPAATYTFTVKAFDNLGAFTISDPITVIINVGANGNNINPISSITAPTNNSSYNAPANVEVQAQASDTDGTIRKVEFLQNGVVMGADSIAPYTYMRSGLAAG